MNESKTSEFILSRLLNKYIDFYNRVTCKVIKRKFGNAFTVALTAVTMFLFSLWYIYEIEGVLFIQKPMYKAFLYIAMMLVAFLMTQSMPEPGTGIVWKKSFLIPALFILVSYFLTGIFKGAHEQMMWIAIYLLFFIPFMSRIADRDNRRVFIHNMSVGIVIFAVALMIVSIAVAPYASMVDYNYKKYVSVRYASIYCNPGVVGYFTAVISVAAAYLIIEQVHDRYLRAEKKLTIKDGLLLLLYTFCLAGAWYMMFMTQTRSVMIGFFASGIFEVIMLMKCLVSVHAKLKNIIVATMIVVVSVASAYKFTDVILQKNLRFLGVDAHYTAIELMFTRTADTLHISAAEEAERVEVQGMPEHLSLSQREVWAKLDLLTTHRIYIWYTYAHHLGILGHTERKFSLPGYPRNLTLQSHNVILELAFKGGIFAGVGILVIGFMSFLYSLKLLFTRKYDMTLTMPAMLTMLYIPIAMFITINNGLTYPVSFFYYLMLGAFFTKVRENGNCREANQE